MAGAGVDRGDENYAAEARNTTKGEEGQSVERLRRSSSMVI